MSLEQLSGYIRGPEDGEAFWVVGGLYTYRAVGAENGDAYTLIEVRGRDGFGTPQHFHDRETEGFYVLEGEVTLVIGEKTIKGNAGTFAFAPVSTPHAFRFDSPEAKLLLLLAPSAGEAGHEGLFREMGEAATERIIPPPPGGPLDLARLAEVAAKHGTTLVGPPIRP
jgi:quercetin dioxygenase-like cupin family protein